MDEKLWDTHFRPLNEITNMDYLIDRIMCEQECPYPVTQHQFWLLVDGMPLRMALDGTLKGVVSWATGDMVVGMPANAVLVYVNQINDVVQYSVAGTYRYGNELKGWNGEPLDLTKEDVDQIFKEIGWVQDTLDAVKGDWDLPSQESTVLAMYAANQDDEPELPWVVPDKSAQTEWDEVTSEPTGRHWLAYGVFMVLNPYSKGTTWLNFCRWIKRVIKGS